MMTEEEAKTKWCPFARVLNIDLADDTRAHVDDDPNSVPVVSEGNPHNRIVPGEDSTCPGAFCIASACMAWVTATDDVVRGRSSKTGHEQPWEDWMSPPAWKRIVIPAKGRCGLVRAP